MAKKADEATTPTVGTIPEPDRAEIAALSYEQARDELAAVVARLEGGQLGLEESMALWKRGEVLAEHCTAWLDGAQRVLDGDAAADE